MNQKEKKMKIWKYKIIKEDFYKELKKAERLWGERENIIKDNDIQREKKRLEKKYKKYIGKYYYHDEGFVFQITGIYYRGGYYNKFMFNCRVPNWDDGTEVEIEDIVEKKYEETTKGGIY